MSWIRNLRNDQLSGLLLVAVALFVMWENRAYPLGSVQEPGPAYTPLLIAIFLALVGITIVLRGRVSARVADTPWREAPRAIVVLVACGVATFFLEWLGYRLTIAALLVFFLGVVEHRKPLQVTVVSLGFAFLSFYLIGDLLKVPLPVAPWGW